MKKLAVFFVIIVVVLLVLGMMKDQIIKGVVTVGISKVTGAPVEIDSFSLGIFTQVVEIKGFRMYHPKGFPEGILLDIPIARVAYDIPSLLKGKIYLKEVVLDVKEVGIVRNSKGVLNVDTLTAVTQAKAEKPKTAPKKGAPKEEKKEPSKKMAFRIDELKLSIGKLVYSDYRQKGEPIIQVFNVGMKEKTYKNITSAEQLVVLLLTESMKSSTIKGAGIYGVATILGAGFLPVGVAAALIGKDSAAADFRKPFDTVYAMSIEALQKLGKVTKEDKRRNVIKGKVQGAAIVVKFTQNDKANVGVEVSARKYMLPKPEIAGGVLHEISQRLK